MRRAFRTFFTSDLHLGHASVVEYCNRPFSGVIEMDYELVRRWNDTVRPEDQIYVLGDVCFHKASIGIPILQTLMGHKILIRGNHDRYSVTQYMEAGFEAVLEEAKIELFGYRLTLSHYPYWPKEPEEAMELRYPDRRPRDDGGWLLCGHVHEKWKKRDRQINVGVDQWNFRPVPEGEIESLIRKHYGV